MDTIQKKRDDIVNIIDTALDIPNDRLTKEIFLNRINNYVNETVDEYIKHMSRCKVIKKKNLLKNKWMI